MALETVRPGANGSHHANAARTLGGCQFFARTELWQGLGLKFVERPGRGVAQLVHAWQVFGDVGDRFRVLEQGDQVEGFESPLAIAFWLRRLGRVLGEAV